LYYSQLWEIKNSAIEGAEMNDKAWRLKNSIRMGELRKAGDSKGVRRLQFGRYVRDRRLAIDNLSQSKAAKLARISPSQWLRIEAGKHLPRPNRIGKIADAIRVEVSALYRMAGYEVPKKYARYDLKAASRDFTIAITESFSFAEFIARMQEVWQLLKQDQKIKRKGFFIDHNQAEIMANIYKVMTPPQRIKLARELVRTIDPKTIRATLRDAPAFIEELEYKVGLLEKEWGIL
jgi:transcriptional regulator with XRE-family HTH domain